MTVIFTDLDGTLLDAETYSFQPALPMIECLNAQGVPWLFVTSKTRAETEVLRHAMGNHHPFIIENGGAAYIPEGYFDPADSDRILEFGTPYPDLVHRLAEASRLSNCPIEGFHDMNPQRVSELCALPLEQARLAKQREYGEPFLILDATRAEALLDAIEDQGLQWTRGGRFFHVMGNNDKGQAVTRLIGLYQHHHGNVQSIGLGDNLNDISFLSMVDSPVAIQSPAAQELKSRLPHIQITTRPGPEGWAEALSLLLMP